MSAQQLPEILQSEIDAIRRLLHSLDLESAALSEDDPDALEEIVHAKQEEIRVLEMIGKQREHIMLQRHGGSGRLHDDENPFEGDQKLSALWEQLTFLAAKCRDKNRTNGAIVESLSRHSRQALDILQGLPHAAVSGANLYDQTGHTSGSATKRSLTQV